MEISLLFYLHLVFHLSRPLKKLKFETNECPGVIVAGHSSAVATASQINKVKSYRDPESFADIVRGMQMYGRKILRPEGIVTAKYNAA